MITALYGGHHGAVSCSVCEGGNTRLCRGRQVRLQPEGAVIVRRPRRREPRRFPARPARPWLALGRLLSGLPARHSADRFVLRRQPGPKSPPPFSSPIRLSGCSSAARNRCSCPTPPSNISTVATDKFQQPSRTETAAKDKCALFTVGLFTPSLIPPSNYLLSFLPPSRSLFPFPPFPLSPSALYLPSFMLIPN